MCEFCKSIQRYENDGYPQKNKISIVYDEDMDTFDLWYDGGGDSFVCCAYLEDIKYCPKCGRKLKGGD